MGVGWAMAGMRRRVTTQDQALRSHTLRFADDPTHRGITCIDGTLPHCKTDLTRNGVQRLRTHPICSVSNTCSDHNDVRVSDSILVDNLLRTAFRQLKSARSFHISPGCCSNICIRAGLCLMTTPIAPPSGGKLNGMSRV